MRIISQSIAPASYAGVGSMIGFDSISTDGISVAEIRSLALPANEFPVVRIDASTKTLHIEPVRDVYRVDSVNDASSFTIEKITGGVRDQVITIVLADQRHNLVLTDDVDSEADETLLIPDGDFTMRYADAIVFRYVEGLLVDKTGHTSLSRWVEQGRLWESRTYDDSENAVAATVVDPDAIHDNVANEISVITEKTIPLAADLQIIEDTADSNNKKRLKVGNLPGGVTIDDNGNLFTPDGSGIVVGHTAKIDFGAIPEFQVLGTGTSDSSMGFGRFENNASGPDVRFLKSRAATIGANVIVQDGDILGRIRFQGADGGDFNTTAAQILAEVDGTPGLNDIPGRIAFYTRTAAGSLSEKMGLTNAGVLTVPGKVLIGTSPSTEHTLGIDGDVDIQHLASEGDDHALEIDVDVAGFGDVKAIDVIYKTGAIGTGSTEGVILVDVDEDLATGGVVDVLAVLASTTGAIDKVNVIFAGIGINPVEQLSGTFGNADSISVDGVDKLSELSAGGGGGVSVFEDDNDPIIIGFDSKFQEIEIIVATGASGAGIAPTFEFSTGSGPTTWSAFTPIDGTNGFRNTGEIIFTDSTVPGWVVGSGTEFLIRITRTRNNLGTTPIINLVQVSATANCFWDKDGKIRARILEATAQIRQAKGPDIASATALAVTDAGNYFDVTGTTTITSFDTTGKVGTLIGLHFDGILTLTHHATNLALLGNANIVTAAGDEATFIEVASGQYRCVDYQRRADAPGSGLTVVVDDLTPQLGGMLDMNGQAIGDGTRKLLTFTENGSAVNHVNIRNNSTSLTPVISAVGDDANIGLTLLPKGSETIRIVDGADTTKVVHFSTAAMSAFANVFLTFDQTGVRIIKYPNATTRLLGDDSPQTITNKSISGEQIDSGTLPIARIADDDITYAKIQNVVSDNRILGNISGAGGIVAELTKAEVLTLLNVVDGANAYVHPNHSGDVTSVADGATAIGTNKILAGMITADAVEEAKIKNGAVTNQKIGNGAVTYNRIQDVSATNRFLGRNTAGAGVIEEIDASSAKAILAILAADMSDFESAVSANSSVAANTSKVTNATHTGEVTGATTMVVDKTAISGKGLVTAAAGDHILVGDASDSDNLKKVTAQTIADLAGSGVTDHGALTGLSDDDHSIYPLLLGRSGGQTIIGGTGIADDLKLQGTSHGTPGHILFGSAGTSGFEEATGAFGIGTLDPQMATVSDLIVAAVDNATASIAAYAFTSSSGQGGAMAMGRARGTQASKLAIANGDVVGTFLFRAWATPTVIKLPCRIQCKVDGTVTSSLVPMSLNFRTGSSGSGAIALDIDSSGDIDFPIANQRLTFASTADTFIFGNSSLLSLGGNIRIDFEIGDTIVAKIDEDSPGVTPRFEIDGYLVILDGVTAPGTNTGHASLYIDAADDDLKVKFADGTVVVLAAN